MDQTFLSFIVKDSSNCSDNLINISYGKTFDIICTCGINYCDHSDYIVKCMSKCVNHNVDYGDKNYTLISFKNNDYIEFKVKDILSDDIHEITLVYLDDNFCLKCNCSEEICRSSKYSLLSFLLRYGENKHKYIICEINNK